MRPLSASRLIMFGIIGVVILCAVALPLVVRWMEPRIAFFPAKGEDDTPRKWGVEFGSFTVETKDGEKLHGWTLRAAGTPRARVLYFHGNGGNLSVWAPILAGLAKHGYEVAAFDYRGYGLSTGRPTERGLYRDVEALVALADGAGLPLIFWGRSLGVSMASYAASLKAPHGLILESGFPDARALLRGTPLALLGFFASYRFSASEHLKNVRVPALVIHGDVDSVIPYAQGQQLFDGITGPKQFVTIRGGDHNDAEPRDAATYWHAVDEFVRARASATAAPPR